MSEVTFDLDDVLTPAEQSTHRVGVAFDDDGQPTVGFIITSKDGEEFRRVAHTLRANAIKRQANKKSRIDTKTDEGAVKFDEIMQGNELKLAVAATIGWFGFTHQGQPIEFTKELVEKVYAARPTWRERVSAALEVEENFLKPSSTNSANTAASSSE